jgi:hypothetical protein
VAAAQYFLNTELRRVDRRAALRCGAVDSYLHIKPEWY